MTQQQFRKKFTFFILGLERPQGTVFDCDEQTYKDEKSYWTSYAKREDFDPEALLDFAWHEYANTRIFYREQPSAAGYTSSVMQKQVVEWIDRNYCRLEEER